MMTSDRLQNARARRVALWGCTGVGLLTIAAKLADLVTPQLRFPLIVCLCLAFLAGLAHALNKKFRLPALALCCVTATSLAVFYL